jgi:hypothetical protein
MSHNSELARTELTMMLSQITVATELVLAVAVREMIDNITVVAVTVREIVAVAIIVEREDKILVGDPVAVMKTLCITPMEAMLTTITKGEEFPRSSLMNQFKGFLEAGEETIFIHSLEQLGKLLSYNWFVVTNLSTLFIFM